MYDISLSYMMYLPVSHSIAVTIILRSAFCKIHLLVSGQRSPSRLVSALLILTTGHQLSHSFTHFLGHSCTTQPELNPFLATGNPLGQSEIQFLWHEVTKSNSTPTIIFIRFSSQVSSMYIYPV